MFELHQSRLVALMEIGGDFEKKGRCDFTFAKDVFGQSTQGFLTAKNSPFTKVINLQYLYILDVKVPIKISYFCIWYVFQRLMKMDAYGLLEKYSDQFIKEIEYGKRCLNYRPSEPPVLSLGADHLSGAFIAIVSGYIFSFLIFLAEWTFRLFVCKKIY